MIVGEVTFQQAPEMSLMESHNVIEAFPANRSDQPFHEMRSAMDCEAPRPLLSFAKHYLLRDRDSKRLGQKPGRPKISKQFCEPIQTMAHANPLWRDPEHTIPVRQPEPLPLAFQDGDLLAESEVFKDERLMATRKEPNQSKQTQRRYQHG